MLLKINSCHLSVTKFGEPVSQTENFSFRLFVYFAIYGLIDVRALYLGFHWRHMIVVFPKTLKVCMRSGSQDSSAGTVSRSNLLNLVRRASKFGKIWSACGQHKILSTE